MLEERVTAIVAGQSRSTRADASVRCSPSRADAFNHGGTPEFAVISAVAVRHDISNTLSTAPDRFEPIYPRKPNRDIDARPCCWGFYAAMQLRMSAGHPCPTRTASTTACSCSSSSIPSTIKDISPARTNEEGTSG